jgi:hypothetical protein
LETVFFVFCFLLPFFFQKLISLLADLKLITNFSLWRLLTYWGILFDFIFQ